MKDSCTSDNHGDFRQRYRKTIGKYIRPEKDPMWVYIEEVSQDGVKFTGLDGETCFAVSDSGVTFEFTQVPLGWYNSSEGPMLFSRKPARQWQRGICTTNTNLQNSNLKSVTLSLNRVSDVFTFNKEWNGKWPWALSRFFAINEKRDVLFLNTIVGELDEGESERTIIVTKGCTVVQELKDVLRRNNLNIEVKEAE